MKYVFHRILAWKLRESGEVEPVVAAAMITSALIYFNLLSLYEVVSFLTNTDRMKDMDPPLRAAGLIGLMVLVGGWSTSCG